MEMWLQPLEIVRLQIQPEQIAQAAIHRVEILSGAVGGNAKGAAALCPGFTGFDERFVRGRRVHV
jgi:hypothetical protein